MQLPSPLGRDLSLPAPEQQQHGMRVVLTSIFNGLTRWLIRAGGNFEIGNNAGSEYVIDSYDDAGVNQGNALVVERPNAAGFMRWFFRGKIVPAQDTSAIQTGNFYGIFAGTGVPSNANGVNGDYYLRGDTPGVANQRIYIKSAGAWVGIV